MGGWSYAGGNDKAHSGQRLHTTIPNWAMCSAHPPQGHRRVLPTRLFAALPNCEWALSASFDCDQRMVFAVTTRGLFVMQVEAGKKDGQATKTEFQQHHQRQQ